MQSPAPRSAPPGEVDEAWKKSGQRLPAPGGGDHQSPASWRPGHEKLNLMGSEPPPPAGEPAGEGLGNFEQIGGRILHERTI